MPVTEGQGHLGVELCEIDAEERKRKDGEAEASTLFPSGLEE